MARFFIHRPVFAWVLAIVTMLVGAWSVLLLPVSQYPDIAPTTVRIVATYPGATARAVQNSVTTPIEDALTGLDGLLYTTSISSTGRADDSHELKAWSLIDAAGLRGHRLGGAQMSEKHPNFLLNADGATAAELEGLGEHVRARVRETSGHDLQWEVIRVGER